MPDTVLEARLLYWTMIFGFPFWLTKTILLLASESREIILYSITVHSLILWNGFWQISLKLLSTVLCNFALNIYMEIVRFGCNKFFLITSGRYSSGTCPLHPMQNVQGSNSMGMQLFIIIVASIHANWSKQAVISREGTKSKVKVTKKVIKCKNIKCHNFDSKFNRENPMWLRHPVTKIFVKNHSV